MWIAYRTAIEARDHVRAPAADETPRVSRRGL
jgi:hypothetical protein